MDLDEMKQIWESYDRRLDQALRINRLALKEVYGRRARFALWRLAVLLIGGALLLLVIIAWLGRFIADNIATPQFAAPAILLEIFAVAGLITHIMQITLAMRTRYSEPVAAIQLHLEQIRRIRVRVVQVAFVTSVSLWLPIFIVGMKGLLRIDIYRHADHAWLVSNAALGVVTIPIAVWLVRRYSASLVRSATGYNLAAASEFVSELAEFVRD